MLETHYSVGGFAKSATDLVHHSIVSNVERHTTKALRRLPTQRIWFTRNFPGGELRELIILLLYALFKLATLIYVAFSYIYYL